MSDLFAQARPLTRVLHVVNGDTAAAALGAAALTGDVVTLVDVLHEGPTPAGLASASWRRMRARFVADRGWASFEDALARFAAIDRALARAREHDEIVLWFEADLCCQLALARLLARFAAGPSPSRLSLVCIDAFPGVDGFRGLGQLDGRQIASLYPSRAVVTDAMLALATTAWRAFAGAEPAAIEAVVGGDTAALPFLAPALRRHLEQFPALGDGLSRTERDILNAVADGVHDPAAVFRRASQREPRPFMGDVVFWSHAAGLAAGREPLLTASDVLPGGVLALTDAGRAVLAGDRDRIALNGVDRWLGGVHLRAGAPAWRWDAARGRLAKSFPLPQP